MFWDQKHALLVKQKNISSEKVFCSEGASCELRLNSDIIMFIPPTCSGAWLSNEECLLLQCDVCDFASSVIMPTLKISGYTPVLIIVLKISAIVCHPSFGRRRSMSMEMPDAPGAV